MVEGFPNMLMVMGPHTALGNIPRSIEYNVEWVTGLIRHMREHGAARAWMRGPSGVASLDRSREGAGRRACCPTRSIRWMTGINRNVEGKQTRIIARYSGSAPAYRARCDEVAADGYQEVALQ